MIYPHYTVAPVIETIFIEGFKFEICEFIKESRSEFKVSDRCRFFLVVEDAIFGIKYIEKYYNKTNEVDYSIICADKNHLKNLISDFEKSMNTLNKYIDKCNKGVNFNNRVNEIKLSIKNKWGVSA